MENIYNITPEQINAFIAERQAALVNADLTTLHTFKVIKNGEVVGRIQVTDQMAQVLRQNPTIIDVTPFDKFETTRQIVT